MNLLTRLLTRITLLNAAFLLIALLVMVHAARRDIGSETAASLTVGKLVAIASAMQGGADLSEQVRALDALNASRELRHFHVALADASGTRLTMADASAQPAAPAGWFERLLVSDLRMTPYHLALKRADGSMLDMTLVPNPYSESAETLRNALLSFGMFALLSLALLGAVWFSVQRAFLPLKDLLSAIARFEQGDFAVRLKRCASAELDAIGQALNHLADSLRDHIARQRHLLNRMQDIQEDERRRLAHDLHDEFGQSLTALQVEASFLARQVEQPKLKECAEAIYRTSTHILGQVKDMLRQLRPYGVHGQEETRIALEPALNDLVQAWRGRFGQTARCDCRIALEEAEVPQRLAVAIYRIVQECLTNVMRHAQARQVEVMVAVDAARQRISVAVRDDGIGMEGAARSAVTRKRPGLGLVGMRERVLANQGELRITPNLPQGLLIEAVFPIQPEDGVDASLEPRHAA